MDIEILLWLQEFREAIGGCLDEFFVLLAHISVDFFAMLPFLILFWIYDKRKGIYGLASYGLGCFLNATFKGIFNVYRPWVRSDKIKPVPDALPSASGYSFPSGHSTSAAGFYGGLILSFGEDKKFRRLCFLMIALVMFSRLYLGVHTLQDVIVGALLGLLSALVVFKAAQFIDKHPDKDWLLLLIVCIMSAILLPYLALKKYPMDYVDGKLLVDPVKMTVGGFKDPGRLFGVVVGWFIERRFIKFDINGTASQKRRRAFIGSLLFIIYWTVVVNYIGNKIGIGIVHFFLQASAPALFMTVYPMLFKIAKK